MIRLVEGDLFDVAGNSPIGHGVNCQGRMGAGIAVEFKRRYPAMFREYRQLCEDEILQPGEMFPYLAADGQWVYNLASQRYPGRDARLGWVRTATESMLEHAIAHQQSAVYLPRIASGYGGLPWANVRTILGGVAAMYPIDLVVVSQPDSR